MFKIRAHITPETATRLRTNKAATGYIYLELDDDVFFPEENWNDFIVAILAMWIKNSLNLVQNSNKIKNYFMDGDYCFQVSKIIHTSELEITLYGNGQRFAEKIIIDQNRYFANLRGAAKDLLYQINQQNIKQGVDIEDLHLQLQSLIALTKKI